MKSMYSFFIVQISMNLQTFSWRAQQISSSVKCFILLFKRKAVHQVLQDVDKSISVFSVNVNSILFFKVFFLNFS